jgi:hypothetical protein
VAAAAPTEAKDRVKLGAGAPGVGSGGGSGGEGGGFLLPAPGRISRAHTAVHPRAPAHLTLLLHCLLRCVALGRLCTRAHTHTHHTHTHTHTPHHTKTNTHTRAKHSRLPEWDAEGRTLNLGQCVRDTQCPLWALSGCALQSVRSCGFRLWASLSPIHVRVHPNSLSRYVELEHRHNWKGSGQNLRQACLISKIRSNLQLAAVIC